jgi:UDP-hydrolysing UDP-N-acetyl-D-glucosamine 2-epimerase
MRRIAVATSSRAEYSSCRPILRALAQSADVAPRILAAGTHLVPEWGGTIDEIEAEGFAPVERVGAFAGTTAERAGAAIGIAAESFAAAFERDPPDILVVVGDRIELLGIVGAALPFRIPVAHVAGGDVTGGAIDDLVRHAVSKLAHLHFVAMPEHAARLERIGEDAWRITVTGDPALDDVRGPWPGLDELSRSLGHEIQWPLGVVGFHPATLAEDRSAAGAVALLEALATFPGTLVMTYPGADPGADDIARLLEAFAGAHPRSILQPSLGQDRYYTLLANADILVGNTSSGIWEAPSFELPAVNIGERQQGRVRAANVIDVPEDADAIASAVTRALTPGFRDSLRGMVNPYGDGHAASRIINVLREVELNHHLIAKASP